MAIWQGVNINSGTPEGPKDPQYSADEIWQAALGTTLANGDVINFMTIPAGTWLNGLKIDTPSLDSASSGLIAFEVGYVVNGTTTAAGFIASGNTTARAGGITSANVSGTVGYTNATYNTLVQAKITAAAGTAVAGTMVCQVGYTPNP